MILGLDKKEAFIDDVGLYLSRMKFREMNKSLEAYMQGKFRLLREPESMTL